MYNLMAVPPASKDVTIVAKDVSFQMAVALGKMARNIGYKDILIVESN